MPGGYSSRKYFPEDSSQEILSGLSRKSSGFGIVWKINFQMARDGFCSQWQPFVTNGCRNAKVFFACILRYLQEIYILPDIFWGISCGGETSWENILQRNILPRNISPSPVPSVFFEQGNRSRRTGVGEQEQGICGVRSITALGGGGAPIPMKGLPQ